MSAASRPPGPSAATLAVNAGSPYQVITFGFSDASSGMSEDMRLPELSALVILRPEDESAMRAAERDDRQLICVLDPSEPQSQIGAFTFMGRVSGFRDLRDGRVAAEFISVGPVMPHFLRR
jgi:hypothetical protein